MEFAKPWWDPWMSMFFFPEEFWEKSPEHLEGSGDEVLEGTRWFPLNVLLELVEKTLELTNPNLKGRRERRREAAKLLSECPQQVEIGDVPKTTLVIRKFGEHKFGKIEVVHKLSEFPIE